MNFDFLKPIESMRQFSDLCINAEILALDFPVQSVITSRKAMEYIVKLLYSASIDDDIRGININALLSDKRFVNYMDDKSMMDAFHSIRIKGNVAAHQDSGITITDSINVLRSLQYVAGEIAISLGFIKEYPTFDEKALPHTNKDTAYINKDEEISVDPKLLRATITQFNGVRLFSEAKKKSQTIVTKYENPVEMGKKKQQIQGYKGVDLAGNSRIAFQQIGEWIKKEIGDNGMFANYGEQTLTFIFKGVQTTFAVRTGACRIATINLQGGWDYMPGIDFVLYCTSVKADIPILEQFHVFSVKEFVQMWDETKFIRPRVSRALHARMTAAGHKVDNIEYADSLVIQTYNTAKQSRQKDLYARIDAKPTLPAFFHQND
jgi:hypothetical protein